MHLHECLKQLPSDMRMIFLLDGKAREVGEILSSVRDEPGYELLTNKRNYGREIYYSVYATGIGTLYNQE